MNEIRVGKVSSINYKDGTADIVFNEEEEVVKNALPFFSAEYQMPNVGDVVVTIFQSNTSRGKEQGYILGPVYNGDNQPEQYGKNVFFKRFSDSAYIMYDPDSDTLEIRANHVVVHNLNQQEG